MNFLRKRLFLWLGPCCRGVGRGSYQRVGPPPLSLLVHLPDLSVFSAAWFWTTTVSPQTREASFLEPIRSLSSVLENRFAWACSLKSASNLHSFRGWYLSTSAGRKALSSLPKMIIDWLRPWRGSGVLWCSRRARAKLSVSRVPPGPRFPLTSLLAAFTASLALLLALG